MGNPKMYEQVSSSGETLDGMERETMAPPPHWRTTKKPIFISVIIITILLIAITITTVIIVPNHPIPSDLKTSPAGIIDCGESPEEALANGCIYDTMMQLWVAPECHDEELASRYLARGKWKWYFDAKAKHEIPDEVLRMGNTKVLFTTDAYHRSHCMFTWEYTVRAIRNRGNMLREMFSYDHVYHCGMVVLSPPWNGSYIGVEIHTGYSACAPYDVWINNLPEDEHSSHS